MSANDTQFERKELNYFSDVGVALSLNVGYMDKKVDQTKQSELSSKVIPILEALEQDNTRPQREILASNINEIAAYRDVLKINIREKLDASTDRWSTLKAHLSLLARHYERASEQLKTLDQSRKEITEALSSAQQNTNTYRSRVDKNFATLDPSEVDEATALYLDAKENEVFAQTYLVLTDRLRDRYIRLQTYNQALIKTLSLNQQALVSGVSVVFPDGSSALLDDLGLIKSEAQYNSGK